MAIGLSNCYNSGRAQWSNPWGNICIVWEGNTCAQEKVHKVLAISKSRTPLLSVSRCEEPRSSWAPLFQTSHPGFPSEAGWVSGHWRLSPEFGTGVEHSSPLATEMFPLVTTPTLNPLSLLITILRYGDDTCYKPRKRSLSTWQIQGFQ